MTEPGAIPGHPAWRRVAVLGACLLAAAGAALLGFVAGTTSSAPLRWATLAGGVLVAVLLIAAVLGREARALVDAAHLPESVFVASPMGMLLIGVAGAEAGRVVAANPAASAALGHRLVGRDWSDVVHPDDRGTAREALARLSGTHGTAAAAESAQRPTAATWRGELRHLQPGGAVMEAVVTATLEAGPRGDPVAWVQMLEVPDRTRMGRAARPAPLHDPVTGLPARALLVERVAHALVASDRSGADVAVLCCLVDDVDRGTDPPGKLPLDVVLTELAGRLRHTIRLSDTVARTAPDALVVVCTDLDSAAEAEMVAERLLAACAAPIEVGDLSLLANVGIGVVVAGPEGDAPRLLGEAETAARYSLAEGGGWRAYGPELDAPPQGAGPVDLGEELRRALRDGELRVYYQPILSVDDRRVVAVEALVRWQHPERGLLAPAAFLGIAEQSDLVCDIDAWVAAQATADAASWPTQHGAQVDLHLNLSGRHLGNHDAAALVDGALRSSGLTAGRLVLELSEASLLLAHNGARGDVDEIRRSGVRLAAHDFGTGDASLDQLVDLPLDMVKVDREFVARLDTDPRARAVVRAVAGLGRTLKLAVVAEGVERDGQRDLLAELGIGAYQGFLHAPPVDADTLHDMLALAS